MYFWDVKKLKAELRAGKVTEADAFRYFMAYVILDALMIASWGMLPSEGDFATADFIESAGYVAIVVVGTVALYRRNGGGAGKQFFIRYFPLLWVVGIRFFVVAIAVSAPLLATYLYATLSAEDETANGAWYLTAAYLVIAALYYWRLYVHIGDVARAGAAATE